MTGSRLPDHSVFASWRERSRVEIILGGVLLNTADGVLGIHMSEIQIDPNSPDVSIHLIVGGEKFLVAKIGPTRLVMRDPRSLPATSAELVIVVNGERRSRNIMLPHGVSADSREVAYF